MGKLSFEHVPPKSAFNKATVVEYKWEDKLHQRRSKGKHRQGGVGSYTLCETCNNNTGDWYAREYVKWARTCHDILVNWSNLGIEHGSICLVNVYPLRFLKQVVTCLFSVVGEPTGDGFAKSAPELVRFVQETHNQDLPAGFRFFLNLYGYSRTGNTALRRSFLSGKITVQHGPNGELIPVSASVFDEITHPPFQLIMTQDNMPFPNAVEITNFSDFGYDDQVDLEISLRVVRSDSPYPGAG